MEFPMNVLGYTICHAAIVELNTPLCRTTMTDAWLKTRQRHPFLRAKWDPCGFIAKVTHRDGPNNTQPTYKNVNNNRQFVEKLRWHANKEMRHSNFARLLVYENGLTIQILGTAAVFLFPIFQTVFFSDDTAFSRGYGVNDDHSE